MSTIFEQVPSFPKLLSAYASVSTMIMMMRTIFNEMFPPWLLAFLQSKLHGLFPSSLSSTFTFVVEDRWHAGINETFQALQNYLPTKIGPATDRLLLGNNNAKTTAAPPKCGIPLGSKVVDTFMGYQMTWTLLETAGTDEYNKKQYFELLCSKQHRDIVITSYIPHVCKTAEEILSNRDNLTIYTYESTYGSWESATFDSPARFECLAMEPESKAALLKDLEMFKRSKDHFRSLGRVWKRGYLLHGPPGTGKSTLVAAIANHMRYDIYDLQLQGVANDSQLRRILTSTTNRSILLIEDIDCSTQSAWSREVVEDDKENGDGKRSERGVTLSGLLNFVDGLWSSCGEERLIIFTTNYKDRLDPALLRPGRMDEHIYMGYCSKAIFRKLASTYLKITEHRLFESVDGLLNKVDVTPAEVSQQLMRNGSCEDVLGGLLAFLKEKADEVEVPVTNEEDVSACMAAAPMRTPRSRKAIASRRAKLRTRRHSQKPV